MNLLNNNTVHSFSRQASEKALKQKQLKAESLKKEKAGVETESNRAQSELAKVEADLHDCQNKYSVEASRIQSAQRELTKVTSDINDAEQALAAAKEVISRKTRDNKGELPAKSL